MQDITVDVNGDKGPNKWGRDKFELWVDADKSMITPSGVNSYPEYCTTEKLPVGSFFYSYIQPFVRSTLIGFKSFK